MEHSEFIDLSQSAIKLGTLFGHDDEIRIILFSPDNQYIFTGGWDNTIRAWYIPQTIPYFKNENHHFNPNNRKGHTSIRLKYNYRGHKASITSLAIDCSDRYLFSGSKDGTVKIWNIQNGELVNSINDNIEKIFTICISRGMEYLVFAGSDTNVHIWRLNRSKFGENGIPYYIPYRTLYDPQSFVHVVKINNEERLLAASGDEKEIYLWSFPEGNPIGTLKGHKKDVYSIDFHPNRPILASAGKEKRVLLWNYRKGTIIKEYKVDSSVEYVNFNNTGQFLMITTFKNRIMIFDLESDEIVQDLTFKEGQKLTIGLSRDWKLFALAPFAVRPIKLKVWMFNEK